MGAGLHGSFRDVELTSGVGDRHTAVVAAHEHGAVVVAQPDEGVGDHPRQQQLVGVVARAAGGLRWLGDALAAAERIQQVMTTPFKLSELEIRVECAIGVALMQARAGPGRAVPQRPVRGQAGQGGGQAAGLRAQGSERRAAPILDRDRASPGARQGPAQAILPAADRPEIGPGRRVRGAGAVEP